MAKDAGVGINTKNPTMAALRKSNVPLYIQLAGMFRQKIESGQWPVGQRIPTVKKLVHDCGVATLTIRQSLDILEDEGLIERFRAKGTFVRMRPGHDLWCNMKTDWTSLSQARDAVTIDILEDEHGLKLPKQEPEFGKPALSYRRLQRRHRRGDEVFHVACVFLDERLSKLIDEKALATSTTIGLISDLPGVTIQDGKQIFTIGSADLEISTLLNLSIGDPIAKVRRVAINQDGEIVLATYGVYRGDMTQLELELRP